ncbi:MAG: histidine kinase [Anaerolineae bacterium]|jgi:two-component system nitrate/nitrite sensor histidine kinase NarX|nr:histidine kinase [Anaerolineae bacterium]
MNKNWWRSLRTKIIAWSFVPVAIILSAVAWATFHSYQRALGDLVIRQGPETAQPKATAFGQVVAEVLTPVLLPVMLDIDTNHELPLETRVQNILDQAKGLEIFDGGLYFLDQHGKVFRAEPPQPELIGQDWSDTPHFRSVNASPNLGADTDVITLAPSGRKVWCLAMALAGQTWDEVRGAAYYCFAVTPPSENAFYQKALSLDLGPDVMVLDRNHQVLYSPDLAEMGRDLSGEAYIQQLSQGESKSGRFRIGNEDMVVSYVPVFVGVQIDRASWFMVSAQPWAEIMPYRQLLFALLALGVIAPVAVTAYGVRHITEPIKKLIHAAEQVTAGKFGHRIEVKTGDEIETLADQFNLMSAELDASYASLEKRVADRTRELEILNSIISGAGHSLDIREILDDALENTVAQMGFDAGAAFRTDAQRRSIHLMAQRGLEPAFADDLANHKVITGRGVPAISPSEVTTLGGEDYPDEASRARLLRSGLRWLVYVPLATNGDAQGFLILGKREPGELSPEERSLLSSIGRQVGVAMENARLYEQAEQAATAAERNRLARELHDAVTQTLFSANLIADVIPRIWKRNPEEGLRNLEELRQLTRGALAEMRTLLLEMRPESLARSDLRSLLTQLTEAFVGRVRVPVDLTMQGDCELTQEVKLSFYRVAQEALNNIAKHSGARRVELRVDCEPGHVHMAIRDDGLGFDADSVPSDHLGLAIMHERAGSIGASLVIESQMGEGTSVALDWRPARKEENDGHTSDDQGDAGR